MEDTKEEMEEKKTKYSAILEINAKAIIENDQFGKVLDQQALKIPELMAQMEALTKEIVVMK